MVPEDFGTIEKLVFPVSGSAKTPPHSLSGSFEFKDYSGKMFACLRRRAGIEDHEYLSSLAGKLPLLDFITNSKSGEFFFFTHDRKYMIKTQPQSE